jgi:hypothetical protein
MAEEHARLTRQCLACHEPRLHLKAIFKQSLDSPIGLMVDGKPIQGHTEIDCKACNNTELVLTEEGQKMLEALKPQLANADKIAAKDLAKAEKAAKQQPTTSAEVKK